jgi:predicted acyl esterase
LGEPYGDGVVQDFVHKALTERSAYYIDKKGSFETPILAQNGFTDFAFPIVGALQMYNRLLQEDPNYPMSLEFGDFGHPIAQNKNDEIQEGARLTNDWFDHYLRGKGEDPSGVVEARLTDCSAATGPLYRSDSWEALQAADFNFDLLLTGDLQTPNRDAHSAVLDALTEPRNVCRKTDTQVMEGNLAESIPLPEGLTMMGLPEVTFDAQPSAADMYVAVHLWDVDPTTDQQTLVTRGLYRLGSGVQNVSFQLFGNAYTFSAGHSLKLELTADDSPSFQASTAQGTISISNVSLSLPVANPAALVGTP